jgi:hypothetical protein
VPVAPARSTDPDLLATALIDAAADRAGAPHAVQPAPPTPPGVDPDTGALR